MGKRRDTHLEVSLTVIIGSIIIIFLLGIFIGLYITDIGKQDGIQPVKTAGANEPNLRGPQIEYVTVTGNSTASTIGVPAVDDQGNGVVTNLDVQVSPGSGKILANIDKLFFWVDTQNSIRKATEVASRITGQDLSKVDISYTVRANASVIEGGSAGAALTIGTIAALQNRQLNRSVMITGTINEDGTIGPIGEVVAKAIGAKEAGAKLFLVPNGQGSSKIYRPEKKCFTEAGIQICETSTVAEKIYITKDVGIEVREVRTVEEALENFFSV